VLVGGGGGGERKEGERDWKKTKSPEDVNNLQLDE
jgi:hypothetical protein